MVIRTLATAKTMSVVTVIRGATSVTRGARKKTVRIIASSRREADLTIVAIGLSGRLAKRQRDRPKDHVNSTSELSDEAILTQALPGRRV